MLGIRDFEEEIFAEGLFGDYRVRLDSGNRVELTLENFAADAKAAERVGERFRERFGLSPRVSLLPFGSLTDYRAVRVAKPILKVEDRRPESMQQRPEVL